MAVLNKKEEKIQAVLGRLPKKYTQEEFVAMFIKLYGKDWGKIKSAYIKQSQDKEPGTVINMPKPEAYLKQLLAIYLTNNANSTPVEEAKPAAKTRVAKKAKTETEEATVEVKASPKKKPAVKETETVKTKSTAAKNKTTADKADVAEVKVKSPAKKKTIEKK